MGAQNDRPIVSLEQFVFGRLHSAFIPFFAKKDIAWASLRMPLSGGTNGATVRPTPQPDRAWPLGCSDGRCPFASLVVLPSVGLVICVKHLFVAAIGGSFDHWEAGQQALGVSTFQSRRYARGDRYARVNARWSPP